MKPTKLEGLVMLSCSPQIRPAIEGDHFQRSGTGYVRDGLLEGWGAGGMSCVRDGERQTCSPPPARFLIIFDAL